jgi:hypothetical protein
VSFHTSGQTTREQVLVQTNLQCSIKISLWLWDHRSLPIERTTMENEFELAARSNIVHRWCSGSRHSSLCHDSNISIHVHLVNLYMTFTNDIHGDLSCNISSLCLIRISNCLLHGNFLAHRSSNEAEHKTRLQLTIISLSLEDSISITTYNKVFLTFINQEYILSPS